jgi:hypothetical protein
MNEVNVVPARRETDVAVGTPRGHRLFRIRLKFGRYGIGQYTLVPFPRFSNVGIGRLALPRERQQDKQDDEKGPEAPHAPSIDFELRNVNAE